MGKRGLESRKWAKLRGLKPKRNILSIFLKLKSKVGDNAFYPKSL
jgi:hypothetical protein